MRVLSTPEQQFGALVATEGSRPFVTYYSDTERTELSVRSLANWVAKTHYLLVDELGLGPGDTARLALPAHWISVPVLLGCLTAGLALSDDGPGEVAFGTGEPLDAADVYAVNPARAAAGFGATPPEGTLDYVGAVRPQGDLWAGVQLRAGGGDPCLPDRSRAAVVAAAAARAAELGLVDGGRLVTTREWSGADDWLDAVLTPLAVGGSLVIVAAGDVDRVADQERATTRLT